MLHIAHYHHQSGLYSILSRGHVLCHLCHLCPMFSGASSVQKHLREALGPSEVICNCSRSQMLWMSMVENIIDYSIWFDISHMSYQKKPATGTLEPLTLLL